MAETPAPAAPSEAQRLALVLSDGTRIPVRTPLTIGRGDDANVRIPDQTVSRAHARVWVGPDGPLIEDMGSRFGTIVSGDRISGPTRLLPGAQIRVGDVYIAVESETRRQLVPQTPASPGGHLRPRRDRGGADRRHADGAPARGDAERRREPATAHPVRLRAKTAGRRRGRGPVRAARPAGRGVHADGGRPGGLFELLDGKRSVTELLGESERLLGAAGPGRLAHLLAELADRGLLDGVGAAPVLPEPESAFARLFKPREKSVEWVGDYFPRAYHHWGRVFFSPLTVTFMVLFALAGFGGFAYIVGARFGTPFIVANRVADRRRGVRRRPVCARGSPRARARPGSGSLRQARARAADCGWC